MLNFISPHNTLSRNSDKTYTLQTLALCAGITDKVWDVKFAFKTPYINDN
jgi:hypothetical protein